MILAILYSSFWLSNTIYEMMLGIEQLFYYGIELGIVLCFLLLQYLQRSRQSISLLIPILMLSLNIIVILQKMNHDKVFLFLLPPLMYDHINKDETMKLYFTIFKFTHLMVLGIWKTLDNLNRGQPIIITFLLMLFTYYDQNYL